MNLSEWEKGLLTEEVCLLCHSFFVVELMELTGQIKILGTSGTFAFYNLVCPKRDCPFNMTAVVIRTQRKKPFLEPSLEAVTAVEAWIQVSGLNCGTCGESKIGDVIATVPYSEFPAFWINFYCLFCETKNSRVIWWKVVNPLDMILKKPLTPPIPEDLVLEAHEVLKKVSSVSDLFR